MKQETSSLSILAGDPKLQLEALKASRLQDFVKDPLVLGRMYEAALYLLKNDALRRCDEASIFGALYKAVTMKFRLEEDFGEYYLIPRNIYDGKDEQGRPRYKSVCTGQIGYKGWKALALQSGHVISLEAREVYKEDHFAVKYGTSPFLDHVPADVNSGEMVWFYAMALLPNGVKIFEVGNKQRAEKSRRNSETQWETVGSGASATKVFCEKPPHKSVWAKHYAAMALRTQIKAVCAMLPLTDAMESAMREDGALTYLQKDGTITTITPSEVEATAERPQDEKNATDGLNTELANKFLEVSDALAPMDFSAMLHYFKGFDQSELAGNEIFARLFFEAAVKTAKTVGELKEFYDAATRWRKNPSLIKLITDQKSKIENAKN
jgi:phage RecT family recombinase